MNYFNLIESFYPSLTKSERKVADYVLNEKSNIIYTSMIDVATSTKVGDATIVRFCRKIGYDGFQDLKLAIAKEASLEEEQTYESYIDGIEANFKSVVAATKDMLDIDQLHYAINKINKSQRVLIYGVGSSGLAAEEMSGRLLRVGKVCKVVTDPHLQSMNSAILNEDDIVIAFSLSGRTKDILESVEIAKNNGATIIAITNFVLSSLAKLSDCVLLTAKKESLIEGGSLIAKISQLYIIDLLCTGYALLDERYSNEMREKTARAVLHKVVE